MKKIYSSLVAVTTLLAFSLTVVAQRPKMEFINNSPNSRWTDPINWKRNGVQQTAAGLTPQNGDSIFIATGAQAYIAATSGNNTLTVPLNNVVLIIQASGNLQMGNSGNKFGVLQLDNASAISVEGSG